MLRSVVNNLSLYSAHPLMDVQKVHHEAYSHFDSWHWPALLQMTL